MIKYLRRFFSGWFAEHKTTNTPLNSGSLDFKIEFTEGGRTRTGTAVHSYGYLLEIEIQTPVAGGFSKAEYTLIPYTMASDTERFWALWRRLNGEARVEWVDTDIAG